MCGVAVYLFTITDKRKRIFERDEPPIMSLFYGKKGVPLADRGTQEKPDRIVDPKKAKP
jgi:hypothetical protein